MTTYGYVRVSTRQQKTQRQVDNIKSFCPSAVIYEEKQSGKDIEGRAVFRRMIGKVKAGDTVVFDEVSRMSRNAEEGYRIYMELMEKGVDLVFLKERHIDTDEYRRRAQNHIEKVSSSNEKMDKFVNGILDLVAEFEQENLKDNIRIAFEQAEGERRLMIRRVKEGKAASSQKQGRPPGSRNRTSEKPERIRKVILEQSRDFSGRFSDAKIMREYLPGIARNTYYRYKRELRDKAAPAP